MNHLLGPLDFAAYEAYLHQMQALAARVNLATPESDPHQAGTLHRLDLGQTGRVCLGRVVDAIAYTHWYKVIPHNGHATIPCCYLSSTSLLPYGARMIGQLAPNTPVVIYHHPSSQYGYILGVVPTYGADPTLAWGDWIVQGGGTNFKVEAAQSYPFSLADSGGIIDFSAGRPFDGSTIGEWGYLTETGLGIVVDPFMAFLRADEECGLFLFYWDQMARLAGHNLELRSAGTWWQSLDDEGETNLIEAATPFFWEALGAWSLAGGIHSTNTDRQVQIEKPYLAKIEAAELALQQPFYRLMRFRGYLGQAEKSIVSLPGDHEGWQGWQGAQGCQDAPTEAGAVNRYNQETIFTGVLDEQRLLTGRLALRSAKAISLVKRLVIPVPKQINLAENPLGDHRTNYKAAGMQGAGVNHVVGEFQDAGAQAPLVAAAAVMDLHAYIFNWEGLHPFHYHERDWYLPDESDLGYSNMEIPSWSQFGSQPYLERPEPIRLPIDHRYDLAHDGLVDYFPNCSYVELLDDGGVLIGDGFGAEIRMTGGSVHITCPGDIWLQSGKNVNCWAGYDLVGRARNSVDLSASEGDVRLKAEYNMQLLGGNSGAQGGVLVESRATCFGTHNYSDYDSEAPQGQQEQPINGQAVQSSGIVLKAAQSQIVAYGAQIYLRTGISAGGVAEGDIVIDAAKGGGNIRTMSCNFDRFVGRGPQGAQDGAQDGAQGYYRDFFGMPPVAGNFYTSQMNYLWGGLYAGGSSVVDGGLLVFGSVGTTQYFASQFACDDSAARLVCCWPDGAQSPQEFRDVKDSELDKGVAIFEGQIEDLFWDAGRVGHADLEQQIGFAFRVTVDYRAENFFIFENRWQQLARISGQVPGVWVEQPATDYLGNLTYPHPGYDKWKIEPTLRTLNLRLYDVSAGTSKDRTDPLYQDPIYATPASVRLDGNYPII